MSSPHPSDETANISESASRRVKITAVQNSLSKNGHDDQSDALDFPDGGLIAWGTALGAFLIQFCGFGYDSFTLYFYTRTYLTNNNPSAIASILLTQGIGSGVATGLTTIPSIAIVSHHFQQCRSVVMGLVVAGASLGAVSHPILLNNIINGKLGFANGVRASAGMIS
ncbi:hypothetical protein K503DRAFT_786633, partial [Rhizopogon vinicolor AM-OR11-026]